MSPENLRLIHKFYEAYNRGDMQGVSEVFDREGVWNLATFTGWLGEEVYTGPDGVSEFFTEWRSIFGQDTVARIESVSETGNRIVVFATQRSAGADGGDLVHQAFAQVYSFRDGRIERVDNYRDGRAALEALGLAD